MALSEDLISQFVKVTNDENGKSNETTVYGEIYGEIDGTMYVHIDGADEDVRTPVNSTVDVKPGDRVAVLIKDHTATVMGSTTAPSASLGMVQGLSGDVNTLQAGYAEIETLKAGYADIETLKAGYAEIDTLKAKDAEIEKAIITEAEIETLIAKDATINDLKADVGKIDTLIFGDATGDTIQTEFSNSVIAQVGDAQIKDAMIENISAGKITAGEIITNDITVKSKDGLLLIEDETMQISDENNTVRVQIGKDASDDYSINVWDADGNLMFSEGGITDSAIKDAIIRNDMVADDAAISGGKIDMESLFESMNGSTYTLKTSNIYYDDKEQTLDVAFKTLSEQTNGLTETVNSQGTDLSVVQGKISSKIWEQDITTAVNGATEEMNTKYSTLEQNLEGFKTTVGNTYTTKDDVSESIATAKSSIEQSAERVAISAAGTAVESAMGNYYTKEETQAEIEVAKKSITSTVATKDEISTLTQTAQGLRADLNATTTTANTAKNTAEGAATTANTAKNTAEGAATTANTAKSTAEGAATTANTAKSKADTAAKTATDYLDFTANGLEVGYSGTSNNVLIHSNGVDIRNGDKTSAIFEADAVKLGITGQTTTSTPVTKTKWYKLNGPTWYEATRGGSFIAGYNFTTTTTRVYPTTMPTEAKKNLGLGEQFKDTTNTYRIWEYGDEKWCYAADDNISFTDTGDPITPSSTPSSFGANTSNGKTIYYYGSGSSTVYCYKEETTVNNTTTTGGEPAAVFSANSARIGLPTSTNVYIDTDSVDIMKNGTTLSTFGANKVELGKNSTSSVIDLCNNSGTISATDDAGSSWDGLGIEGKNVCISNDSTPSKGIWGFNKIHSEVIDGSYEQGYCDNVVKNSSTALSRIRSTVVEDLDSSNKSPRGASIEMYTEAKNDSTWKISSLGMDQECIIAMQSVNDDYHMGTIRPWAVTLWTGGTSYYMTNSQTATFTGGTITEQPLGIVLVFRECNTNGTAVDSGIHTYFVPKQLITDTGNKGFGHAISWNHLGRSMYKYLYIHDTKIVGHANNDDTDNNKAVLWKVYGV